MPAISINDVLTCPTLPTLPAVAVRVLELTSDPEVNINEIARLVQNDQALSGRILRTVNSSYYGLSKPCPSISRAMKYLGLGSVKSLVLGFSLVDITRQDTTGMDLIDYWRRSVYSAAAARRIAMLLERDDPDECFLAALMQDVGMLALQASLGRDYVSVIAQTEGDHLKLPDLEQKTFGFTHAEVGDALGTRWRLPTEIVQPIRHHHDAYFDGLAHEQLLEIISLANLLASFVCSQSERAFKQLHRQASEQLGIASTAVQPLVSALIGDASELSQLLKVQTGEVPDSTHILAMAEEARIQHELNLNRETEELRQSNTQLAHAATTDALTGINNRAHFDDQLALLFAEAQSEESSLGVIICDVDRFKSFNDTYGHQAGDVVLQTLAQRMSSTVPKAGVLCRYGGEEFVVLLPKATRQQATRIAEALRSAIQNMPVDLSEVNTSTDEVDVTASFGVAVLDADTSELLSSGKRLVQAADRALYAAKEGGRNCVRVFSMPRTKKSSAA